MATAGCTLSRRCPPLPPAGQLRLGGWSVTAALDYADVVTLRGSMDAFKDRLADDFFVPHRAYKERTQSGTCIAYGG
jgi:hypothetical protein